VTFVAYLDDEFGQGEAARRLAAGFEHAGIPLRRVSCTTGRSPRVTRRDEPRVGAAYDTNVICANGNHLPALAHEIGLEQLAAGYTVAFWAWETTAFPESWRSALHFVDEVWVESEFVRSAVASATWKPVHVVPMPLEMPAPPALARKELGLPDGFVFLFSFDFLSVFERKNPLGLLDAFSRAFSVGEGPSLVIKCSHGGRKPSALRQVRDAAAARPDVYVLDEHLSPAARDALMASCDCYVSLHRSEGLGLTLAEAMAYAKPVIATGYSGNLEFMDERNSYLVPCEVTRIPHGSAYPPDGLWATPDVAAAAKLMRHVYDHPDEARARGALARQDIGRRFSTDRTASFIRSRLEGIQAQRGTEPDALGAELKLAVMRISEEVGRGIAGVGASSGRAHLRLARRLLVRALWPQLAAQHRVNREVLDALDALQSARRELTSAQATSTLLEGESR
jgi:glycosyltransferase involved in cell wall biosynthesis